jgi:hypothetical protein
MEYNPVSREASIFSTCEVAFAQNVRLGFRAFQLVTPSKIEKLALFQNTSTY